MQSPVSVQVAPFSTVITALLLTELPPCALSTMLMVPVNFVPLFMVRSSVEMLSTSMAPSSVWLLKVAVTWPPLLPALPQPFEAELPEMVNRLPPPLLVMATFVRSIVQEVFVT